MERSTKLESGPMRHRAMATQVLVRMKLDGVGVGTIASAKEGGIKGRSGGDGPAEATLKA